MDSHPSSEIQSNAEALVVRLMEITRGPLPRDVALHSAMQVIFVGWQLSQNRRGSELHAEIERASRAPHQFIEAELRRSLKYPPQPDAGSQAVRAISAMWNTVVNMLSGDRDRDLPLLRSAFEGVIRLYTTQGLRGAGEYIGPHPIVRLSMAAVGEQASYIDPASGYGSTLLAAHQMSPTATLTGFDINQQALGVAEMRLHMNGGDPDLSYGNAFECSHPLEGQFAGVIVQPPWSALTDPSIVARRTDLLGNLPPASLRTDLAWVELSLHLLAPGGRAAVFLTQSSATSSKGQGKSHQRLLDLGAVEAIVEFPQGGMAVGAAIPSALWILRKNLDENLKPEVLLVDASTLVERGRTGATLSETSVLALVTLLDFWRRTGKVDAPSYLARALSVDQFDIELRGLLPSLYLDEVPEEAISLPEPPKRLISRLSISGYKAFSEPTNIDLAPLTLVYGANSAGKSSIIQSLLLLKQSIESDHLVTQGDCTDVGNFEGVSSRHRNEDIEFGIEYGSLPSWIPAAGTADPAILRDVRFTFRNVPSKNSSSGAIGSVNISWGGLLSTV